ncbi:MAG: type II toxin-antitoxin system VapC family toxin [Rhizobiales bacterium]|nr:type II toxin-antitoxin system VapC family toxin [Hyphomicrobiales bacterium]
MRLVDSSLWIETLLGSPLAATAKREITPVETCVVPTLVQHEVYKWLCRERSQAEAERVIALTMTCIVVPLDSAIALRAADIAPAHKLHTSDAIIYATALMTNAELLTCDVHFQGLAGVRYFKK